jgi:hypothetical protein
MKFTSPPSLTVWLVSTNKMSPSPSLVKVSIGSCCASTGLEGGEAGRAERHASPARAPSDGARQALPHSPYSVALFEQRCTTWRTLHPARARILKRPVCSTVSNPAVLNMRRQVRTLGSQ